MRSFTTKHTVYTFDELSPEAQEKAIAYFQEHEDFPMLSDDLGYRLEELLNKHNITFDDMPKVYYSLSSCQGDGAMFEGRVYWNGYTVEIKQSGHYYHFNSKDFEITDENGNDVDGQDEAFNSLYVDISKQLEAYGYDVIDNSLSDDTISDNIKANEYEFYADGSLA